MRICVVSPGVVHAVPRTIAIADQFDEIYFVDMNGSADSVRLASHGIKYCTPDEDGDSKIDSFAIQNLFRKIKPGVIVCHYASGDHFFNAIAYGRCHVSAIAMGHDVLYDEGDSFVPAFRRFLTRIALRRCLYISAKSKFLAKRIKKYGVRPRADVNYWGADFSQYYPGIKDEVREKLNLKESRPIILSPRAIEPRLNIHLIVEAFSGVLSKYPNALLIILGRSRLEYRKQIEKTIEGLDLANNVCVLKEVSQDVLSQYYQASDVVVSMARSEGFPNTLLEAMACKVPIVVGRIAQIEELLVDSKNAWICEIEPGAIATAIVDVLSNSEKRERISNSAYATVNNLADIKKNGIIFSNNLKQRLASYQRRFWIEIVVFRVLYFMYRIHRKIKIL